MSLAAGTRLGPYEVIGLIGAGGMGEVYRAHDTRLDRTVAIKVLPADISADPDRRARFEREAKTIAGLTHPHICPLYDVGEHDGAMFLVMEHLDGETLAHRIEKGPLPINQALTIAIDIAGALSAAHRHGVVHRDLKPGNVMLTKSGAKLLDFGLAKLAGHVGEGTLAMLASASTRSAPLTGKGVIVGTLPYMAPEQIEGRAADARTDLWAFGGILYEMVTGKRAFEGASAASLMGAILEREPTPMTTAQPLTPAALDRLVRECLAKSPDDRPDTAHDLANELRRMQESSGLGGAPTVQSGRRRGLWAAFVVGGSLALAAGGAGFMWLSRVTPPPLPVYSSLDVRPADELNAGGVSPVSQRTAGGSRTAFAWTPDGRSLVFVGRRGGGQQLFMRRLDTGDTRALAGTSGAQVPAVSLDGQSVAFWTDGAIKKMPLAGGPVVELARVAAPPLGLVWDSGGGLFFGQGGKAIQAISPKGSVTAVTVLGEEETSHGLPWPLPDQRALLFTARKREWSWGDEEIVVQTLSDGKRKVLLKNATDARYLATGHLGFMRQGVLFAVAFDAERLECRGPEVAMLDNVVQALLGGNANDLTGAGQFAIAATGALAHVSGAVPEDHNGALVTVDRRGNVTPLPVQAKLFGPMVRLSPDGRHLAVTVRTRKEAGLWVYEFDRGLTPLTVDGEISWPLWSPTEPVLFFTWLKHGRRSIAMLRADGTTSTPQTVMPTSLMPSSVSADGRQLAAVTVGRGGDDVTIITLANVQSSMEPWLRTPHVEQWAEFSPDGRWLAYATDESGRFEVYVQPYPEKGARELVSTEGGSSPAWHRSGRELFYVSLPDEAGKHNMMAVDFQPGAPPRIGTPQLLFQFDPRRLVFGCSPVRCYDVAPDGQRFVAVQTPTPPPAPVVTHINLIQNWFEELKAKVPTGK